MDNFDAKLAAMQEQYAAAKAQQEQLFGGAAIDPGIYEARLTKCELTLSKKGKLQIKRTHIITSAGDFEGIPVTDYMQLETEYGWAFARRWIEQCGKECPEQLLKVKQVIADIAKDKTSFRIEIRRDGDFTNVVVMEQLGAEGAGAAAEETAPEAEAPAEEPVVDEALAALKAFATAQEIEISDEDDIDAVKEKISAYNYEATKLTEEEISLLESNELMALIIRPEPKKPAAKQPAKAAAPSKAAPPKRK
jgi:hypothetical protein